MPSILKTFGSREVPTFYCCGCGKKISKKGVMQKTAKHAVSNSLPQHHDKYYCRDCWKQL